MGNYQAQMIIIDGAQVGTTFELLDHNIIGGTERCNHKIEQVHFEVEIKKDNDIFVIRPLDKTPVSVNDNAITQEHPLKHGDMIAVADVMFLYGFISEDWASEDHTNKEIAPNIRDRQTAKKSLQEILQEIEKTEKPEFYRAILAEVEKVLQFYIKQQIEKPDIDLKMAFQEVLEVIIDETKVDKGAILLKDPKSGELDIVADV